MQFSNECWEIRLKEEENLNLKRHVNNKEGNNYDSKISVLGSGGSEGEQAIFPGLWHDGYKFGLGLDTPDSNLTSTS